MVKDDLVVVGYHLIRLLLRIRHFPTLPSRMRVAPKQLGLLVYIRAMGFLSCRGTFALLFVRHRHVQVLHYFLLGCVMQV